MPEAVTQVLATTTTTRVGPVDNLLEHSVAKLITELARIMMDSAKARLKVCVKCPSRLDKQTKAKQVPDLYTFLWLQVFSLASP